MNLKTKVFNFLMVLFIISAEFATAQSWYGQQTYRVDSVLLTTAKVTNSFPGYIMGGRRGVRQNPSTSTPDFVINKTDVNGQLTSANDFNIEYQINGCGNTPHNCAGIAIAECRNPVASNGNMQHYAIAVSSTAGIGFATLDQNGIPAQELFWDFPTPVTIFELKNPAICESATVNIFYITANYQYSTCVMQVDVSVTPAIILWANLYYNNNNRYESRDIIESPFVSNELIVVGRTDMDPVFGQNGWAADAFFTVLNANSGAVITHSVYNKQYDGDDWFSCIEVANSSTGGSQGFLLGGRSNFQLNSAPPSHNDDHMQWVCKLDPYGTIIWSDLIKPNFLHRQGYQQEISSVYERLNSNNGNYEVYAAAGMGGCTWPNTLTTNCSTAQVVYKLDDAGQNVFTPDEFHYDGAWMNQGSVDVFSDVQLTGIENGLGDDGIQIFGNDTYAANFLITKAYFNGEAGCNTTTTTIQQILQGPDSIRTEALNVVPIIKCPSNNWIITNIMSVTPATLCSNSSLTNGSNARNTLTGFNSMYEASYDVDVFPNPSDSKITILSRSDQNISHLVLYDQLGQKVMEFNHLSNKSSMEIDLKEQGLKSGMYHLKIHFDNNHISNQKIVIED